MYELQTLTATIASGASLSGLLTTKWPEKSLSGLTVCKIITPAAWTAANLTFQDSEDGVTFNNVYDDTGVEFTVTAAAARSIVIRPAYWLTAKYLYVRSGTSGTPVNQGADRTLSFVARFF